MVRVGGDAHERESARVKIAIVATGGFDRSGTGRVIPCLLWLIERLAATGHDVHVFVPMQEDKPGTWPLLGATIHNGGPGAWRVRMLTAIVREHARARFDVIHAFWAGMGELAAVASKLLRLPMILTLPFSRNFSTSSSLESMTSLFLSALKINRAYSSRIF